MPGRNINLIVIHCSASPNGVALTRNGKNAATVIDGWHKSRGFSRAPAWRLKWNAELQSIGYHFVIDVNGFLYTGRHRDEIGAHVAGYNMNSIGICCVGYDKLSLLQWSQLASIVLQLKREYPNAKIVGHRDLSPDLNHDGKITSNEYMKLCPGFNVSEWLTTTTPLPEHTTPVLP
jgi:N-acetylmuramoyl-L-alanine amidase